MASDANLVLLCVAMLPSATTMKAVINGRDHERLLVDGNRIRKNARVVLQLFRS
jgi:hypothetical protein